MESVQKETPVTSVINFGTVNSVVKSITRPNDINAEVDTQLQEAHNRVGQFQAMQEFINTNLNVLPVVAGGLTTVRYKDERGNWLDKEQDNNLSLWVITLNLLQYSGHINYALLASAIMNWSEEVSAGVTDEQAKALSKAYVSELKSWNIVNDKLEDVNTSDKQGSLMKVRALTMTPEFISQLNESIEPLRQRAHMICKPLTNKPEDWTDAFTGVGENAKLQLIRGYRLKNRKVAPKVLQAVNKLQSVKFVVAPCIIEAAKDMRKNQHLFRGPHIKYFNQKKELSKEAFALYEEILKYQSEDGYYFPITMDTRGRMYYRGGLLSPQGVDFCKAAFQFAEKKPLGEHGFTAVCIHTANVFGYDKASIADRLQWVKAQWHTICELKTHRDVRRQFSDASPFQALVAAKEIQAMNAWQLAGLDMKEFKSGLVCHQDGTCNGLQHMAAVTRDRATAEAVNCVASTIHDNPADVYGLVSDEAKNHCSVDEALVQMMKYGRDMAKNPVMVTSYGATGNTIQRNIVNYLANRKDTFAHAESIADAYLAAIGTKAGAVTQLTESLKICVNDALAENPDRSKFVWVTADGFKACTEYREEETFRVRVGKLAARMRGVGKAPLDVIKTAGAMAPNFIHSIDATHLRMVVNGCDHDLVTVHDSIGSHACDFHTTARVIREKFALVHKYNALEDLCSGMGQEAPEFIGDYDASEALQSTYIFS